jgi:hypothetical protein
VTIASIAAGKSIELDSISLDLGFDVDLKSKSALLHVFQGGVLCVSFYCLQLSRRLSLVCFGTLHIGTTAMQIETGGDMKLFEAVQKN